MDRKEFARQYHEDVKPIDIRKYRQERERQTRQSNRNQSTTKQARYTAQKGTMSRAKSRKRKPNTRLAALILAAAIGVGGITVINHYQANKQEPINMIEIEQEGVNPQSLGLSVETIELFEKYDEYFDEFDEDNQYGLTDEQVTNMIDEIRGMHFSVVKEKIGSLVGEDTKNIKMYYNFEKADGSTNTSIVINEDHYSDKKTYHNNSGLFFENENKIPNELSDVIVQLEDLDNLELSVETDKITKINAIKKMEKLYEKLEQVATGEFVQDEKGNISIIHYEEKQVKQQEKDERD